MSLRFKTVIIAISLFAGLSFSSSFALAADQNANPQKNEEYNVFKNIPPEKELLVYPQFIVIDDFNTGSLINRRGSLWQTKVPVQGALDLALEKGSARNPSRGYNLNVTFNLRSGEEASFQSFLNRVDISQAEYFIFHFKLQPLKANDFKGRIRVTLIDWKHESVTQDITHLCPPPYGKWQTAILPMSLFKKLDLDQLTFISFALIAKSGEIRGNLYLDDITFFGFNDVQFESNRDNLVGFPKAINNSAKRQSLLKEGREYTFLKEIARDTWNYFVNARDKNTGLIVDHIRLGDAPLAADYTSPTNIAMDLLATVAAMDLEFISKEEAISRTRATLKTLSGIRRFQGLFYNFYDTKKLGITRQYISSVDNGWLNIAFVIVRQAFPKEFGKKASKLLTAGSFDRFLDSENNQLVVGFDVPRTDFGKYHYGMLVTEARATSLLAIGKGDVSEKHWWFLYRTLPPAWKWQTQIPKGKNAIREDIDYFQGYYELMGKKFVPSWGGSLFEFLMPTLVIDEKKYAPKGLGLNNRIATELQRDYALKEKKYPVWGISPCSLASGRRWDYKEMGVRALGGKGYPDLAIVTPHVSFLALDSLPDAAIKNIKNLMGYEIYGEYGLYDSVNLRNGYVNPQYLALDQGMTLVAICNYLKGGSIKKRFHADQVGKAAEKLLNEDFFNA